MKITQNTISTYNIPTKILHKPTESKQNINKCDQDTSTNEHEQHNTNYKLKHAHTIENTQYGTKYENI